MLLQFRVENCYFIMTTNIRPRKGAYEKKPDSENGDYERNHSPIGFESFTETSFTSSDIFTSSGEESLDPNVRYKSSKGNNSGENEKDPILSYQLLLIVLCIFLIFFCIKGIGFTDDQRALKHEKNKEAEFREELLDIRKKFPNQNVELWQSFTSTITTIHPSVFLLLHMEENPASDCLVRQVAHSASKFLSGSSLKPIFIQGEEIKKSTEFINDYGLFLKKYQADLESRNVMVIFNLQDFPPVIAQAFHSLCDPDNPLVKEAAYVFTLKVRVDDNHKPRTVAERVLTSLWNNSLSIDVMNPLIVRIANVVLFVKPESDGVCP